LGLLKVVLFKILDFYFLNIHLGLVNGYQGVVKKIRYNQTSDPKWGDLPVVVFVQCDGYSGIIHTGYDLGFS